MQRLLRTGVPVCYRRPVTVLIRFRSDVAKRPMETARIQKMDKPKQLRDFEEPITPEELMSMESLGKINNFFDKVQHNTDTDLGKSVVEREAGVIQSPDVGVSRDVEEISLEILGEDQPQDEKPALPSQSNPVEQAIARLQDRLTEKGIAVNHEALAAVQNKFKTIPTGVVFKLGGAFNLLKSAKEDWKDILKHIETQADGFAGLELADATGLFMRIPKWQRAAVVKNFDRMVVAADIAKDVKLYNLYIDSLAESKFLTRDIKRVWRYLGQMKEEGLKPDVYTYGSILKALSKLKDIDSMELVRQKMSAAGVALNKEMYTTIMQTCIKTKNYDLAIDTFDNMKLMALSTQPDAKAHTAVILAHVLKKDVEKALDVYEEMSKGPFAVQPEPQALLALARGCAQEVRYILKGWRFIFEYHRQKGELNQTVVEVMMHLAARDGDYNFARALYNSSFQKKFLGEPAKLVNPGPRMLNLYFMACATELPDHVPVSLVDAQVRAVREKVVDLFQVHFETDPQSKVPPPPFLPVKELANKEQVIRECEAFLSYSFLFSKDFVRQEVIGSYLSVLMSKASSVKLFEDAFDRLTYFDGAQASQTIEEITEEPETPSEETQVSQLPRAQAEFRRLAVAIPRDFSLYSIGLKAARVFKDPEFAAKIWTERGLYRKTEAYQQLPYRVRDKQDFEFARGMVSVFIECNLLKEALAIVLASKQRFGWNWYHLKSLYIAAEDLGDLSVQRVVLEITGKRRP